MMATMVLSLYLKQMTMDRRGQGLVGVTLPMVLLLLLILMMKMMLVNRLQLLLQRGDPIQVL